MDHVNGIAVNVDCQDSLEKRMQILEIENGRLMKCQGQIIKETNRKLELYTNENRFLQYAFNKLKKQNEELRELCCFLDDDRKEAKKRNEELVQLEKSKSYTESQQIIAEHEETVKTLHERERALTEENRRLKLMCDSWIEYALKNSSSRDCGDGSSDSDSVIPKSKEDLSKVDEQIETSSSFEQLELNLDTKEDSDSTDDVTVCERNQSSTYADLMLYIKSLETRVQQLEHERDTVLRSPIISADLHVITEEPEVITSDKEGTSSIKEEENSLEATSPDQEQDGVMWANQFEEETNYYLNRMRDGYYSGRDDNDNIVLSPIAEESESESVSSSSTDEEVLECKRNFSPKVPFNFQCDELNDNERLHVISRRNIKNSIDWNENIHTTVEDLDQQTIRQNECISV